MHAYAYSIASVAAISITPFSFHFVLCPMAKCRSDDWTSSSSSSGKHRKTGIDPKWATDFPWVEVSDESGGGCFACCVESTIAGLKKS